MKPKIPMKHDKKTNVELEHDRGELVRSSVFVFSVRTAVIMIQVNLIFFWGI